MSDLGSNLSSWHGSLIEPSFIARLDAMLLTDVLGRLEVRDLASSACVCGAWATAAADDQLWQRHFHALCSVDYRRNCRPQLSSMLSGECTSSCRQRPRTQSSTPTHHHAAGHPSACAAKLVQLHLVCLM